jgi:MFS family permease
MASAAAPGRRVSVPATAIAPPQPLAHQSGFRALWAGQTVSQLGSQVTALAFPLTAALTLHAGPGAMALLGAAGTLPTLLFGLPAGVWVDRLARRPLLIGADLARAGLLGSVPLAALLGRLSLAQLYVVAFLAGVCTLIFDVAYHAILPALVPREQLVDGNSKLELSRSAAEIAGPGLAGGLARAMTAPGAIAVDAVSFIASAYSLRRLPKLAHEAHAERAAPVLWRDLGEGLRVIRGQPVLRALTAGVATLALANAMLETVLLLYLARELGFGAGTLGIVFAAGNVGFLAGALLPARLARRIGVGPSIATGLALAAGSDLLVPLAQGPRFTVIALLLLALFGFGLGRTVFSVHQVSLRQQLTPDALLGRINATVLALTAGLAPLGALLGGALGATLGLRETLFIAGAGELLAAGWLALSPVGRLR